MNKLNMTPVQVAVIIVAFIAILFGAVAIMMQLTGALTNADQPMQVRLDASSWPTPLPTPTPRPTPTAAPTPAPTPVPAGLELLWLTERYGDSVTGLADESYQQTSDSFTEADFTGLGATVSATNRIAFGECVHVTGFPWMRIGLAVPASHALPTAVASGGLNIISALVLQTDADDPTIPHTMDIEGESHHLLISRARLDCRAFGGLSWTVE